MPFMHQNSTTYFHRVCIQSGIVRKKLGFEARCYIIDIYLNVVSSKFHVFGLIVKFCIIYRQYFMCLS
jgi:hypothetical protein